LYVLPSLEEGMSLALLEAMAAGVPVIATDIPANQPLVEHEQEGLLVPPRDDKSLAEAIVRLFGDHELAQRLTAAARSRVERQFSLTACAAAHLDLFAQLVASHRATRDS
jgi:glycosyltransferase involved in cell wall biosynthesis